MFITLSVETISRLWYIGPIPYRFYSYLSFVAMHSTLWVVDSGASSNFSAAKDYFITVNPLDTGTVSGISDRVRGHGTCKLTLVDSAGRKCTVTLNGVFMFPILPSDPMATIFVF